MSYNPDKSLFKFLPIADFDDWQKLNKWKGTDFHVTDFNDYSNEIIMWNSLYTGWTNSRLIISYTGSNFFNVRLIHIGM